MKPLALALLFISVALVSSCSDPEVEEPSKEEYSIYSAFIEDFRSVARRQKAGHPPDPKRPLTIAPETLHIKNQFAPDVTHVTAGFAPEDAARSFYRHNAKVWKLDRRFFKTGASARDSALLEDEFRQVLHLSRVGFNRNQTIGLLYYNFECGPLCGQSGWVLMERVAGTWRVAQFGPGSIV